MTNIPHRILCLGLTICIACGPVAAVPIPFLVSSPELSRRTNSALSCFGDQALSNRAILFLRMMVGKKDVQIKKSIRFHIDVSPEHLKEIVRDRVRATKVDPTLIESSQVEKPHFYSRFRNLEAKAQFRTAMLASLESAWSAQWGTQKAADLLRHFNALSHGLEKDGVVLFGEMASRTAFGDLVTEYDGLMQRVATTSALHSYLSLREYPEFLLDQRFNDAFLHPLLIALIAYRMGGPIRIIDARTKDTDPMRVRALDNLLHIDNTPFHEEYKVLLTWERGRVTGPKGQNFVFLPGTHHGVLYSPLGTDGVPWSLESASTFLTEEGIERALEFQMRIRGEPFPRVIEAEDSERPLSAVFAAGEMMHHRFRTEGGSPRSCLIVAFHLASDNPGQFVHPLVPKEGLPLQRYLMGEAATSDHKDFLELIQATASFMAKKLDEIQSKGEGSQVVDQNSKALLGDRLAEWKQHMAHDPEIEDLKVQEQQFPFGQWLQSAPFLKWLNDSIAYDRQATLDLILYADSREEIRKWARLRIREMPLDRVKAHLAAWLSEIYQPRIEHLLTPEALGELGQRLITYIDGRAASRQGEAILRPEEKISSENAYRSVRQLTLDLMEALQRAYSFQQYVSTSLFLFWAADELQEFAGEPDRELREIGGSLLRHYVVGAMLAYRLIAEAHNGNPPSDSGERPTNITRGFLARWMLGRRSSSLTHFRRDIAKAA